ALGRSSRTPEIVDARLAALVDRVSRRMRAAGRAGRTVTLRLRFDDFTRATRSHTLSRATAHTQTILDAARGLLRGALPMIAQRGVTLVGVAVGNLENGFVQLTLPFDRQAGEDLDAALDAVRKRYGGSARPRAALP